MLETSARLLRLLSLLQARRDWSGHELADRLGVDARTIRRDIDRLRNLGYPVASTTGTAGGYRLEAGANMPPLLLDDEEAVAVAVGVRAGAMRTISGIEEAAARALAKLDQVLPSRLRYRVDALSTATVAVPADSPGPALDPQVLTTLATACRDHQRLRFGYRNHQGDTSSRLAEPHRLVTWGRRWYLVAWDLDRGDWRTFRVDRVEPRTTGPTFTPRALPNDGDVAGFVSRGVSAAAWRWRARVNVQAPAERVVERINPAVGVVEPIDDHHCTLVTGADSLDTLAVHLGLLDADFEVTEPPELVEQIRALADRYTRATGGAPTSLR